MKKLSLNIEELAVESFHIEADLHGRGTVRGRIEGEAEPIPSDAEESVNACAGTFVYCSDSCAPDCTLGCTLAAGCSTLCTMSKVNTCQRSCGYPICIRF
jgi:hypothetical protein